MEGGDENNEKMQTAVRRTYKEKKRVERRMEVEVIKEECWTSGGGSDEDKYFYKIRI